MRTEERRKPAEHKPAPAGDRAVPAAADNRPSDIPAVDKRPSGDTLSKQTNNTKKKLIQFCQSNPNSSKNHKTAQKNKNNSNIFRDTLRWRNADRRLLLVVVTHDFFSQKCFFFFGCA